MTDIRPEKPKESTPPIPSPKHPLTYKVDNIRLLSFVELQNQVIQTSKNDK